MDYNLHMRLTDDFNENDNRSGLPVIYMMIGALAFIVLVVVLVIAANDKGRRRRSIYKPEAADTNISQDQASADGTAGDLLVSDPDFTADDLDFWNMYKDDKQVSDNSVITDKSYEERLKEMEAQEQEAAEKEDLSEGGTKTKVIRPDGAEQWIMINAYLEKNNYQEEGFVYKDPMMKYYSDGKNVSYQGVMLSEDNGKVDYALLKQENISFVMLRYGYRGYESGQIKKDAAFDDNFEGAKNAGLDIGVYFESAAITPDEAYEEADFLLTGLSGGTVSTQGVTDQAVQPAQAEGAENADTAVAADAAGLVDQAGQGVAAQGDQGEAIASLEIAPLEVTVPITKNSAVTYPVAVKLGQPSNHSARTDNMPKTVISQTAGAFLEKISEAGYTGCVWGNKYWLLRRLDLTQLKPGTQITLEQSGEVPDYPYSFSMWQYKSDAKLSALKNDAQMMISFVDYRSQ
ncbi:MAG: hypothetical protein J5842_05495 [Lachnospiraceae bacterium]|nr:hypothetical protein [Lachnospiraceae bacterium]